MSDDLKAAREGTVDRMVGIRIVRPDRAAIIWEAVATTSLGWKPDHRLVAELAGPFVIEQRVIPDGLWVKAASATDGWATLTWEDGVLTPVAYDIETDLGII